MSIFIYDKEWIAVIKDIQLPKDIQEMHLPGYLIEDICLLIQAREEYRGDESEHNHSNYMHCLEMFIVSLKEAEHCDRLMKDDINYLKERYYYR